MSINQKLLDRLNSVWEKPDFEEIFNKSGKSPKIIRKGTIIFNDGEPLDRFFYIEEGFVKLYRMTEDGRDATSYLLGPGYVMGIRALTSEDESAKHYAESLTDLKVISISHHEYFEAIAKNPEYIVDLLRVFIGRLNYTERKLEGFMFADSTSRVANFLADSYLRFGQIIDDRKVIPVKLTHQLIADFVGSFRETTSLAVNKLELEKVIRVNKSEIEILDLDKLKKYALFRKKASHPSKKD